MAVVSAYDRFASMLWACGKVGGYDRTKFLTSGCLKSREETSRGWWQCTVPKNMALLVYFLQVGTTFLQVGHYLLIMWACYKCIIGWIHWWGQNPHNLIMCQSLTGSSSWGPRIWHISLWGPFYIQTITTLTLGSCFLGSHCVGQKNSKSNEEQQYSHVLVSYWKEIINLIFEFFCSSKVSSAVYSDLS